MKSRLAITALFVLSLLLVSATAALATGSDKKQDTGHADKAKNAGKGDHGWDKKHGDKKHGDKNDQDKKHGDKHGDKKHGDNDHDKKHGDKPKSAADHEYGHDEEDENDTLIPAKPGGGASEAGAGGAASAVTVADTTATAGAPGTSPGGPSTLTPGAGLPGSPTAVTTPGAGGPSTVTPGGPTGGDTSGPGEGGLESSPQGGVAGNVASGGNEAAEAPAGADVRSGEQVAATGGSGLAFTGFAAIPLLLVGLAVLTGGLLLRRGRATS